jgi:hypothetical protein
MRGSPRWSSGGEVLDDEGGVDGSSDTRSPAAMVRSERNYGPRGSLRRGQWGRRMMGVDG